MNPPRDPHDPDPLSRLLQSWRTTPARIGDEAFAAGVWRRLGPRAEARAAFAWLPRLFASPLAACFLVIASALAGGSAALAYNHATKTERMAAAYARTIDPLQMAPAGTRAGH
ncbi:MAG: hypothetical protein LBI02_04505 [Opitutaceae bacterium]|jgi:hypothetical protein|nr:hypothetical protein [Opitutaceae bacterium]